ncbi:acyltransferase family protein [Streptomyces sp. NPDC101191]|uniref:acyltransferase family protein n=1 Tax=Streptomyces sp. NPDC101191 TaxID=3366126 RepID=UPI00381CC93F
MPALPTQKVGTSESAAPGRAAYFDNAKLLAVVLVVCGHFWEPLIGQPEQRPVKALYLLVYAFHMPAFVFISGYFTRTYTAQPRQVRRLATGVLIPFILWGVLLALFNSFLTETQPKLLPLTPVWVTWFLIALFLWRLSAPLWQNLRAPVTTTTAVFLAAGAFSLGAQLSITRVLQFLPFFVLGLTVSPERLAWLRDRVWARPAAVVAFVTAGVGAYVIAPDISAVWFYRSAGASELHVSYLHWLVQASAVYAVGLVLTGAFLVLVPSRRTWFTALGAGTMSAFLLHAFVRQAALHGGLYDHEFFQGVPGQAVLTVLSAGLALALCTRPVHRLMRPLIEPRLRWLFRSDEVARHRAVGSPGINT